MKQKLIIVFAITLILVAGFFMLRDLFTGGQEQVPNPYKYDLSEYKAVDSGQVCYREVQQIKPDMDKIKGIALDHKDRIYVTGTDAISIFSAEGEKVQAFAIAEEANCLAVSENGELFIGFTDHIEVRDFSGNILSIWDSPGDKTLITSLALGKNNLYCADAGNKIVYEYNLNGDLIRRIGKKDKSTGDPGFFIPSPYFDLLVGREEELWVVNPGLHAFQSYNEEGVLVSSWKRTSMQLDGFSGCCNPSNVAMLSNGSFVTSEKGIERVKIHLPSGDFLCVVAGPGTFEPQTVGLDLAVDSRDRILVLDPKKIAIRVFEENKKNI